MKPGQALRLLLLLLGVATAGAVALALAAPWLPHPLAGVLPGTAATAREESTGFAGVVTSACAVALVAAWAWLAAGTVVVAVESLIAAPPSGCGHAWVPRAVRVLVPLLVGAAVGAAPAGASTETGPGTHGDPPAASVGRPFTGLPVPDRVLTDRRSRRPALRTVTVRPGDTLWGITARLLPAGSSPSSVDRGWRRIARTNAARLGDPDLIHPGARLRVPPLTAHSREEAR